MKKIKVELGSRSYEIIVGRGTINRLGKLIKKLEIGADAYIITNALIKNKFGKTLERVLSCAKINAYFYCVKDSEKSKSISVAARVIKDIAKFDKQKKLFIIALGGGVVGDLAGFVASVYKRGIPYIQVPTTLLAQVDSSIGGKTAVDLSVGKNLVGAFYQPRLVLSDVNFLKTLPRDQLIAGLAEVIKYALIADKNFFTYLEKNYALALKKDSRRLEDIVIRCARIKAAIVSADEKETKSLRVLLNFGHTIGHAIEAAAGFKGYSHGQAIGMGILAAIEIAKRKGFVSDKDCLRIRELICRCQLPLKVEGLSLKRIIDAHYHDKKFSGKINRFVLLDSIGKAKVHSNIDLELIKKGISEII